MNSKKVIDELKEPYDLRKKYMVIYVSNPNELEILNNALRDEWLVASIQADYRGGIYYTLKRGG